jgi:hypothetical protein
MVGRVSRRAKVGRAIRRAEAGALPGFIPPQLTALRDTAPEAHASSSEPAEFVIFIKASRWRAV